MINQQLVQKNELKGFLPIDPDVYNWQYSNNPSKTGQSSPTLNLCNCRVNSPILSNIIFEVINIRHKCYLRNLKIKGLEYKMNEYIPGVILLKKLI
jgi:hypothetical protein